MLDSAAAFKDRAASIGVTAAELARLEVLNLDTFVKLAYGCSYVPGQADDQPLLTLIERVCEAAPPPEDRVPVIRRLFFESYTLANADLRSRVDRKDDEQPRKLAQAERAARHKDQQVRLAGLELVGELEPSHALVIWYSICWKKTNCGTSGGNSAQNEIKSFLEFDMTLCGNLVQMELCERSDRRKKPLQTPVLTCT